MATKNKHDNKCINTYTHTRAEYLSSTLVVFNQNSAELKGFHWWR